MRPLLLTVAVLALAALGAAQSNDPEWFDTSGMPRRATNFVEQQIFDLIHSHKPDDLADAARIQSKLGRYYSDKGDEVRATRAFRRAAAAEQPVLPTPPAAPAAPAPAPSAVPFLDRFPPPPAPKTDFSGKYWGNLDGALHTWDFNDDSTFLHTWIASGAGTSVRNSERGTFRLHGDFLLLEITSSAGGAVTPGVGGRTTQVVGGADRTNEFRRVRVRFLKEGIVLDGAELKVKHW